MRQNDAEKIILVKNYKKKQIINKTTNATQKLEETLLFMLTTIVFINKLHYTNN